jgi:hypothetical protein
MTIKRAVRMRLERMKRDLLHYVTWRRRETRLSVYLLRQFILFVALIAFPVVKLVQLGLLGFVMGTLKTFLAAGFVIAGLAAAFAVQEYARRRKRGLSVWRALA